MFSVSMTERAKQLLDNDGWEKGKESWLDYRKRTEKEREIEQQKQYKLAADLAEFFNKATQFNNMYEIFNLITWYISHNMQLHLRAGYQNKVSKLFGV